MKHTLISLAFALAASAVALAIVYLVVSLLNKDLAALFVAIGGVGCVVTCVKDAVTGNL